jgi:hypothetical protein
MTRARVLRAAKTVQPMIHDFDEVYAAWEAAEPTAVLRDVIFVVYVSVRLLVEQHRDVRYQRAVADMVAGGFAARVLAKWKEEGSPGAPS